MTYRGEYLLEPPPAPARIVPESKPGEAWVYFHLNAANEVLYIGATTNPRSRTQQHEGGSAWIGEVVDMIWFGPMAELDARSAEREFIAAEQPPNNIRHTDREAEYRNTPRARLSRAESRVERLKSDLADAEKWLAKCIRWDASRQATS